MHFNLFAEYFLNNDSLLFYHFSQSLFTLDMTEDFFVFQSKFIYTRYDRRFPHEKESSQT